MMTTRRELIVAAPAVVTAFAVGELLTSGPAHAQQPAASSSKDQARDAVVRRSIEAMIWGMPAVNLDLMYQAMLRETKARSNHMLYWSRLLDWKNQTLTPNTGRDLPHSLFRHQGRRADGARDSASR